MTDGLKLKKVKFESSLWVNTELPEFDSSTGTFKQSGILYNALNEVNIWENMYVRSDDGKSVYFIKHIYAKFDNEIWINEGDMYESELVSEATWRRTYYYIYRNS